MLSKTRSFGMFSNLKQLSYCGEITFSGVLDHVYHEYSHLISLVVNVTDIMLNNNKETEISYVNKL